MSNHQDKSNWFLENVNWDEYTRYRPPYPPSLEKLIVDFQRAHSNSFRLAHDVGAGCGNFATSLAEYFQHVHVSDINATFVEQARQRLDNWYESNWWKGRFTFSATAAEKADEVAAKGSVDLVTLMQCAHWTDQDAVVAAVARSLSPNGTLVVVNVNPAPMVVDNEVVNELGRDLFRFWQANVLEAAGGRDSLMWQKYVPQGNAGVESVPLPDGAFIQDVTKRIDINTKGRGSTPHAVPGHEDLVAASRADPQHRRYAFTSDNAEGEGWRYAVGPEWFRGYLGTLEQESRLNMYEDKLKEIERRVKETTDGRVTIEWTVGVLFATRK